MTADAHGRTLVYIVSNFPCYSETFVLNELVELRRRGYGIIIFSLRRPRERLVQEDAGPFLADAVYPRSALDMRLWWAQLYFCVTRPLACAGLLWDIVRSCASRPLTMVANMAIFPNSLWFAYRVRAQGVRHLHAHFANYPATCAMIVSRLLRAPFSFTCHAHDIFRDTAMLERKIALSKACRAISQYNRAYIEDACRSIPEGRLVVIHCGIDPERFRPAVREERGGTIRILSVGRLTPPKGFDDLIEACGLLREKGIPFRCDIVGEGPMEGELKRLAGRRGLDAHVRFTGPLSQGQVLALYRAADVFVLASKKARHRDVQDGIPVVLMEAMASGVPVISTTISGIPELIDDGVSGFLVSPGDFSALAEKAACLIGDRAAGERCRENGRRKVEDEFNIRKTVDLLEKVFDG